MSILVTGSNGMLGTAVKEAFKDLDLICTTSLDLDVRNIKQVMSYAAKKPAVILNLAGATDHAACEYSPADAYMVNTIGAQNMVQLARETNAVLVYIGTCGIFDGSKKFYTPDDAPCPLNHYGRSKYYGELATRSWPKSYIVRCGWSFGGGPLVDKKFVNKIWQLMQAKKQISAITDVYGSPTYTVDFAYAMRRIIEEHWKYGTYHAPNNGRASRYEVAFAFMTLLGIKDPNPVALTYEEYHKKFGLQVAYTKCEVLKPAKELQMRDWVSALSDYIKRDYANLIRS